MLLSFGLLLPGIIAGQTIPDFTLTQTDGKTFQLSAHAANRPVVVVFLGVDCPLANLYAPRLSGLAQQFAAEARFLSINSNDKDDAQAVAAFSAKHRLPFPYLKDSDGTIAKLFGAIRTPEVYLLDANRRVKYHGRIDDQYEAGGKNQGKASRSDLAEALKEVLAGKIVTVPETQITGCRISRPARTQIEPSVTYSRDIAPILHNNCLPCHTDGNVAPFPLTSYAHARRRADTIVEVIENGAMPPWHASPFYGAFRNARRLTPSQKQQLTQWVHLGCPEGEPQPVQPTYTSAAGWAMGTPDAVFAIPEPFNIPAEGILEYQHFIVDPGFTAETWVSAAEVRPGNRRVVHHCSVFLQPPFSTNPEEVFETGTIGSHNLIAFTPGSGPMQLPPGIAKRVPAGWKLHFIIHYTPIGTPQLDRTELAVRFLPAHLVKKEAATKLIMDLDLAIPPHAANYRVEKTWTADRDYHLFAMLPHMHLRGKSFRYIAEYPDGNSEILLDVPVYDFNWQHRYELVEPKLLPTGTVLRCVAVYDNSSGNLSNPDPSATVLAGQQSWDEMFNGYFDIAVTNQDLAAERAADEQQRGVSGLLMLAASVLAVCWGIRMKRRSFSARR